MQELYIPVQPEFTASMSALPYTEALHALYVFKTKFGDVVDMTVRRGNTLYVPRETMPVGKIDKRIKHEMTAAIDCSHFKAQNDEQYPLAMKSVELLQEGKNHVFDAPTGWGKTVVGSLIGAKLGQRTMIVVTKNDLVDAWYQALTKVLKIDPKRIGFVQQDKCDFEGKDFVIGMVHSLVIPDRYPTELYQYFGLIIFDEVHLMATDYFSKACHKFPAFYRLGFSATTKRSDGASIVFHSHIGETLVKGTMVPMSPKVLVKRTGWKIPEYKDVQNGVVTYTKIPHGPGNMMLVTKAQAHNGPRNAEISKFVKSAYLKGRSILIMSDLKEYHLDTLFLVLTNDGIPGDQIGYYVGGMTQMEINLTKKKKVVLATYAMCSTGTNVPHWDTLVMATPRANVKQSIGRVLRFVPDKVTPVILDLVDKDKIFMGFHMKRLQTYAEVGAEVVQMP